jgi:hypothetical protein
LFPDFGTTLWLYLVSLSLKRDTRYNHLIPEKLAGCIFMFFAKSRKTIAGKAKIDLLRLAGFDQKSWIGA